MKRRDRGGGLSFPLCWKERGGDPRPVPSLLILCLLPILFLLLPVRAQEDEDCFLCHGEADWREKTGDGKVILLTVEEEAFSRSVHGEAGCVSCHSGIDDIVHEENLPKVDCTGCHAEEAKIYARSLHGQALRKGDPLAPDCKDCHGKHAIKKATDPAALTNPINIPTMCGGCHAEDAPVARNRNIKQHHILQHYEQSIHGEGLLKMGLTVTAVCTSCHTAHDVLPHTDPQSTINRDNVVATCTQCHVLIERVHRKVIEGELWEKEPEKIPICIDCHQPHEARKVYYDEGVSDKDCMACHGEAVQGAAGRLEAADVVQLAGSTHSAVRCAQCHTGAVASLARPCATVASTVDCSICHAEQVEQYDRGTHGQLLARGDPDTPACLDCHSGHGTQSKTDRDSPTFPNNVPDLCGRCHREGEKAATRHHSTEEEIVKNYSMSIHGKGLLESGLVVTATCTSCHTAHLSLPSHDLRSSVNPHNIADTCGRCHEGIEETFLDSVHSPLVTETDKSLPTCSGCHSAHRISRTDESDFRLNVMQTCGRCHEDVAKTYFDTYHGKVSKLGSATAAKCDDCHGAHDVQPISDPRSHLSRRNIVATCGKCHDGSHRRFVGYLTHATHHDPVKYPALFYAFWAMTALLVGTFSFFGLHALAWLPLSFREKRRRKANSKGGEGEKLMFQRFDPVVRQMHFVLTLSFFGLALTGMALKFSYMGWAQWISHAFGGFSAMGVIHRFCAVVMILLFVIHLTVVVLRKRRAGITWKEMFLGASSLMPNRRDWSEFILTVKWFLRKGPRPRYGKWTYWEKFDYFAVFWGVAIIGSTGFMLWFPEFCTYFFPGWFINVATIIHSDEALLAVGFIFTIHFFNTHFRPEKFPMDTAMFTGRISLEELKEERPRQYEELVAKGELDAHLVSRETREYRFWMIVFGTLALIVGFSLVGFIIYSMLFGYR